MQEVTTSEQSRTSAASGKDRADRDEVGNYKLFLLLLLQEGKKFFRRFQTVSLPPGTRQQCVFCKGG